MIRQILDNQIDCLDTDFKYWVTIDWFNKQTNEAAVHSRHKELRRSIRAFYGEPIKTWWFNEVHKDPFSPHYGGYHSHAVVSDCSPERWKNPSRRMERFLSEKDPETLFTALSGGDPSEERKCALLERVLRLSPKTPNGKEGVKVKPITHDVKGLVGRYCVKQIGRGLSIGEVIDESNSDLNRERWRNDWRELSTSKRSERLPT